MAETYRVEEDVGGLEVAVDDLLLRRVQEREASSCSNGDLEPYAPREWLKRCSSCAQEPYADQHGFMTASE